MANFHRGNNTLLDDDDVDDEYFLRGPTRNYNYDNNFSNGVSSAVSEQWDLDNRKAELLDKRLEIEEKTIKSTQRTLQHLRNSEYVGVATAEELLHQREQLERTGKNLDDINSTLRFSQKHIQGIKSVFGGLKNLISGKPSAPVKKPSTSSSSEADPSLGSGSALCRVLDKSSSPSGLHPVLTDKYVDQPEREVHDPHNKQEVLNENMEQILDSVKKLKDLASGLGEEIEGQNDMIESIIGKAERADRTLARQNKDIHKLLK
uniref:t-SNARE coiled-coil homology domain-containing protein n=1 Tax=Rhodnius prolixus TaxID=13249 RepID=A0ABL0EFR2_RHOPR